MKQTITVAPAVIAAVALILGVSACAKRADRPVTSTPSSRADIGESRPDMSSRVHPGTEDAAVSTAVQDRLVREGIASPGQIRADSDRGTVYLKGSVDTPRDKQRAGEAAAGVPDVKTVVNQLSVGPGGEPTTTSRAGTDAAQCSLALRNPAMRTEAIFGPIQVRVFDDVASPLNRKAAYPYDRRERRPLTAAEIGALERQKGRPLSDSEIRSLEMDRARTVRGREVPPSMEATPRPLTEAGPVAEANAPIARERNVVRGGDAEAGETGGREQDTGSAQQAGTAEEIGASRPTSTGGQLTLTERDRLSPEQRARLYGDDARIADRRGNLIWSGWLKPNETVAIPNTNGPIRYDYRFQVDDRFHDERTAWCHNNVITLP